ncbi:MAG: hypothetical protein ACXWDH_08755 [Aeromicrobium sp.]
MKNYTATGAFWLNGNLVAVGDTPRLSDAAAKYYKHVLSEIKTVAKPAPKPVAMVEPIEASEPVAEVTAPDLSIEVVERKPKRRR